MSRSGFVMAGLVFGAVAYFAGAAAGAMASAKAADCGDACQQFAKKVDGRLKCPEGDCNPGGTYQKCNKGWTVDGGVMTIFCTCSDGGLDAPDAGCCTLQEQWFENQNPPPAGYIFGGTFCQDTNECDAGEECKAILGFCSCQ